MQKQYKPLLFRVLLYAAGITILAFGTILSTRTGLGVSCITSAPAAISAALGWNLSVIVFLIYAGMIAAQFLIKKKEQRTWRDLLQFPVALLFSIYLEWFGRLIQVRFDHLWQNLTLMGCAIVLIGIGVCLMVNMEIVPNPPDGLAHTISKVTGKDMGLIKNIVDTTCVAVAVAVDLLSAGTIATVGIGTVCSMILVGRVIYVTNRLFKEKMRHFAGMQAEM